MNRSTTLADPVALSDLKVFLDRAGRVEDGSVRLISAGGVLAVYVAVLYPVGLLDETPTVLGLRTFALKAKDDFDVVVPIRSFAARIERVEADPDADGVAITLPMEVNTVTWAGISPPRGGWVTQHPISPSELSRAAKAGIEEVARALPESAGASVVQKVRAEIWGRPIEGHEHLPAAAAFALLGLGFLGDDAVQQYDTGPWTRLTTQRGHVLIKRRAWTLAR